MLTPDNIRELAYKHIKNYDISDYKDYMLHVISRKVITFCNKDDIYNYIDSLDNREEYIRRVK